MKKEEIRKYAIEQTLRAGVYPDMEAVITSSKELEAYILEGAEEECQKPLGIEPFVIDALSRHFVSLEQLNLRTLHKTAKLYGLIPCDTSFRDVAQIVMDIATSLHYVLTRVRHTDYEYHVDTGVSLPDGFKNPCEPGPDPLIPEVDYDQPITIGN